jgi:hypothetical protein
MHFKEALARTTADGLKHSYFNNTDAISAETLARTNARLQTQLFLIIRMQ